MSGFHLTGLPYRFVLMTIPFTLFLFMFFSVPEEPPKHFDNNGIPNRHALTDGSPADIGINPDSLNAGIERIVLEAIDSGAFPGCQILLAKDGIVFYEKSFGYHTYENNQRVENSDIYDLASVTKTTAATLSLMELYDQGIFDPDDSFADVFPEFDHTNKSGLPMREVLAHQAGLKPWIPYWSESQRKNGDFKWNTVSSDSSSRFPYRISDTGLFLHRDFRTNKIYQMIKKSPVSENKEYVYSGLAFYLIPDYVKRMSTLDFDVYLRAHFYDPLGAETLGFNPLNRFPASRIVPTEVDTFFRMETLHGVVHDEGAAMMLGVSGNAGLFSTSRDLAKVYQMLLNGGMYNGRRFLKDETVFEFTKCQFCDQDNRRGMGFDKPLIEYDEARSSVARDVSPASFGHTGYTGTLVWADPENDLLFIFLSNRVHPTRDNRKIYTMNIRPRIHNLVYELLENSGQMLPSAP